MYIPPINHWDDENEIISFMQKYSFATIISFKDNQPIASHLPLVIEKENEEIIIYGHWAIANPQWKKITDQKVLIIFS